jgi:hypothetical protein
LKVLAFDEARFGLINWHRRRYCPKGFRPPRVLRRLYEWTYLYAAVDPTSRESFALYLPGMDSLCFQTFLEHLGEAYADHHLVVVLDGAPSHTSLAARGAGECEPYELAGLLSGVQSGGEVVFGVQASSLEQDLRDHRAPARGVQQDARVLLGRSIAVARAHRLPLVGASHRRSSKRIITSMNLIGITRLSA